MSVVTSIDYAISYSFTGSSRKEATDISEILTLPLHVLTQEWRKSPLFYQRSLSSFEIDTSSLSPRFVPMITSSLIEEFYGEIMPEETIEYDITVRMPPRKRYTIELEVTSIKKAEPRVVEPEWI